MEETKGEIMANDGIEQALAGSFGGGATVTEASSGARGNSAPKQPCESIGIGRTVRLPRPIVEQAIVAYVQRVLEARGLEWRGEISELFHRAEVHIEATGSAIVIWQE
jgi:hypothetical protein